jgi:hypothetical protein
LFGRCEGIGRERIKHPDAAPLLTRVIELLRDYLSVERIVVGRVRDDAESGFDRE